MERGCIVLGVDPVSSGVGVDPVSAGVGVDPVSVGVGVGVGVSLSCAQDIS